VLFGVLGDSDRAARDDGDSVLKSFHGYLFLDEFFVIMRKNKTE